MTTRELTLSNLYTDPYFIHLQTLIDEAKKDGLRFIRAQFAFLYSEWETFTFSSNLLTLCGPGSVRFNIKTWEAKKRFDKVQIEAEICLPGKMWDGEFNAQMGEMRFINKHLVEFAATAMIEKLGSSFIRDNTETEARMIAGRNMVLLTRLQELEAKLFELPVIFVRARLWRYYDWIERLEAEQRGDKTFTEAAKETIDGVLNADAEAKDKLVHDMMNIERERLDWIKHARAEMHSTRDLLDWIEAGSKIKATYEERQQNTNSNMENGFERQMIKDRLSGSMEDHLYSGRVPPNILYWAFESGWYARPEAVENFKRSEKSQMTN